MVAVCSRLDRKRASCRSGEVESCLQYTVTVNDRTYVPRRLAQPLAILLRAASAWLLAVVAAAHEVAARLANKFATAFCKAFPAHWTVKHGFFAQLARGCVALISVQAEHFRDHYMQTLLAAFTTNRRADLAGSGNEPLCWLSPCRFRYGMACECPRSSRLPFLSSRHSDRRCGRPFLWRKIRADKERA
jgi:hypothetical protein